MTTTRAAWPRGRVLRLLAALACWALWVLCIVLVLPVLLAVPGNPKPWELGLYLALVAAVTHYPILLPLFAAMEWRARRKGRERPARIARLAISAIFLFTAGSIATMAVLLHANTPPPVVLTAAQQLERDYQDATVFHDLEALKALVEGGADIEHRMFRDGTPAINAALHGAWPLLVYLLERGADPDRADMSGRTARNLFERAEPPAGDGPRVEAQIRAYARLREILAARPKPASAPDATGADATP